MCKGYITISIKMSLIKKTQYCETNGFANNLNYNNNIYNINISKKQFHILNEGYLIENDKNIL